MLGCKTKGVWKSSEHDNRQKLAAVVIVIAGLAAFTAAFMVQAPPLRGNQGTDGNSNSNDDDGTGATGGTDTDTTTRVGAAGGGDEQGGDGAGDNDEAQGDGDDDGAGDDEGQEDDGDGDDDDGNGETPKTTKTFEDEAKENHRLIRHVGSS